MQRIHPVMIKAVSTVLEIDECYGILSELYVFLVALRWCILNIYCTLDFSVKSLSGTRCSAHYKAVEVIKHGYTAILQTHIFLRSQKLECKQDAKNLYH